MIQSLSFSSFIYTTDLILLLLDFYSILNTIRCQTVYVAQWVSIFNNIVDISHKFKNPHKHAQDLL